jgi:sulfur carrier protein
MNSHRPSNSAAPEDAAVRATLNAAHSIIAATLSVVVNGVAQPTTARTLAQWLQEQGAAPAGLATAVNGQFVPRALRAQQALAEGDAIVTFQPIEGG